MDRRAFVSGVLAALFAPPVPRLPVPRLPVPRLPVPRLPVRVPSTIAIEWPAWPNVARILGTIRYVARTFDGRVIHGTIELTDDVDAARKIL